MAINKYTFFSPNGNDFPVTSNSDGKLYMMLTGMTYEDYRIKFWENPLNTALNRVYVNTSLVVAGRYFELRDHSITLKPSQTNFVHAVIDISNTSDPVTITVEDANNSNTVDINNNSGVIKRCFDIVTTSASAITGANRPDGEYSNLSQKPSSITKTFNGTTGTGSMIFYRVGSIVQVDVRNMPTKIDSNTVIQGVIPIGYRPLSANTTGITKATNRIAFNKDGSIKADNNALTPNDGYFTLSYVTKDSPIA